MSAAGVRVGGAGLIAIGAEIAAGSIALTGFGELDVADDDDCCA